MKNFTTSRPLKRVHGRIRVFIALPEEDAAITTFCKYSHPIEACVAKDATRAAKQTLAKLHQASSFLRMPQQRQQERISPIAKVDLKDIKVGPVIGTGGFSIVHQVTEFPSGKQQQQHGEPPALALKVLRPEAIRNGKAFTSAVENFATEAHFMAAMDHPHILKLLSTSTAGVEGLKDGNGGYFIISERLTESLHSKIEYWKQEQEQQRSSKLCHIPMFCKLSQRQKEVSKNLLERLEVARDVASAVSYMHEHDIVHRDISSSNIGFDQHGSAKMFDFGLSKYLPPRTPGDKDRTYNMNRAGTPGFMAPEVQQEKPYNEKADVYSFGVVLWEILSLESVQAQKDSSRVLEVCAGWPLRLQQLVQQILSDDPKMRLGMKDVEHILGEEIRQFRDTIE